MYFTLNQNNRIFESKKQRALNKKKLPINVIGKK